MQSNDEKANPVIVFDNGSGYLKAGFSNQDIPEVCIPAIVGRELLRYGEKIDINTIKAVKKKKEQKELIKQMIKERHLKSIMIGDEVTPFRSLLELTHPVNKGIIEDSEDLYKLWDYALANKLGIDDPSDKKVIVTEAPLNPLENKMKICEILFEKIGVGSLNIEPQAKCSLFSEGISTGIVCDSGDGVTSCIPVNDGYILRNSIERIDIGGRDITEYLVRLLQKKGYFLNSSSDFELVREIKEKLCFVSSDIQSDRELALQTSFYNTFYLLPDGSRVRISTEKFEAPEILFTPSLIGKEYSGISETVNNSINKCAIDCRAGLYGSIVLSGANTLLPGFTSRLENEIKQIYKQTKLKNTQDKKIKISINIIDSPKRQFSVYRGACIIANHYNNLDNDDYWITRDEWLDCEDASDFTKDNLIKNKCQSYFTDN